MIQIVYEYADPWPSQGVLQIQPPSACLDIAVSPDSARRKANNYLAMYISMSLLAGKPLLIMNKRPVWRIPLEMQLDDRGHTATFGIIEIDAQTREIIPLTPKQIRTIQDQVNDFITRLTPETTLVSYRTYAHCIFRYKSKKEILSRLQRCLLSAYPLSQQ
ncbi:MAG: hypothetical protein R3C14_20985 [Caldilineaceae bacterium]